MNEKEKNFLGFLGVFVSVVIFFVIISFTVDFTSIKVNALANKMLNDLNEKQYDKFVEKLCGENFSRLDEFTQYQDNINKTLGEMTNYKYVGSYRNKNSNGEDIISIGYDVNFSSFSDKTLKIFLVFTKNNNNWKVSQYKVESGNGNDNIELTKDINYINANLLEENKEVLDAQKIVDSVIEDYDNEKYSQIYTMLNNELKEKGGEKEFIEYLKSSNSKYGKIANANANGYEIGKDKSEYKFNYYLNYENDKKIYITFWVKMKDKLYLSGVNFSEDIW